ncbi:hypothetical protein Salat_2537500 [Sesamum alatum]|uniref:Uncharacterized protein n=1 Tax=Sesamum alatum TaxID=300844 RepID=A0AAE1XS75_9LAMI|nr:hypothetical protein Salat_2537500 [Sesamum alatum]
MNEGSRANLLVRTLSSLASQALFASESAIASPLRKMWVDLTSKSREESTSTHKCWTPLGLATSKPLTTPSKTDGMHGFEASGGSSKFRAYGFGSQPLHRSFSDIAYSGSIFKVKQNKVAKHAQEESNKRFDLLQKEMEKLKQTNMQLQGEERVLLKAMEQCLSDKIRQMLQDIQWTNHSHTGGSGNHKQ